MRGEEFSCTEKTNKTSKAAESVSAGECQHPLPKYWIGIKMLNCTDLACVLHHHHFYAHLHHLKHHLQDDNFNSALGDGSDIDNNDNTIPNTNDTDSDLSSLSHVGAPNDVIYMVCGVVIAMLLVGLIIILVAITINKLRKREESSTASPATIEATQQHSRISSTTNSFDRPIYTTTSFINCNNTINNNNNNNNNLDEEHIIFTRTGGANVVASNESSATAANNWVFPPKAPTPNIYNCMNTDALIAANDKNGFKGFRKQFSGRFKRLVAKKPEPTPAIPPELKPQLKTIYVY